MRNKYQKGLPAQAGVSLIITFFIMIIILAVVLSISTILYSEIKVIRNVGNSVVAFYTADSGVEKVLYYDRQVLPQIGVDPNNGTPVYGKRGICSMCDYKADTNPNACTSPDNTVDNFECNNCSVQPTETDGCKSTSCNNCAVTFDTTFEGKSYTVDATVTPSTTVPNATNLDIESSGAYQNVKRAVSLSVKKTDITTSAPTIHSVSLSSPIFSVEQDDTLTISADITNVATSGIGTVTAKVYSGANITDSFSLSSSSSSGEIFTGVKPIDTSHVGYYGVIVKACDGSTPLPNCTDSDRVNFEVYKSGDGPNPTVADVTTVPNQAGDSVTVKAEISDVSGINYAAAKILDASNNVYGPETMSFTNNNNQYEAIISGNYSQGSTYTVEISATDMLAHTRPYDNDGSFTIGGGTTTCPDTGGQKDASGNCWYKGTATGESCTQICTDHSLTTSDSDCCQQDPSCTMLGEFFNCSGGCDSNNAYPYYNSGNNYCDEGEGSTYCYSSCDSPSWDDGNNRICVCVQPN